MARELVYGKHAVVALLERDPAGIRELWLVAGRDDGFAGRAGRHPRGSSRGAA